MAPTTTTTHRRSARIAKKEGMTSPSTDRTAPSNPQKTISARTKQKKKKAACAAACGGGAAVPASKEAPPWQDKEPHDAAQLGKRSRGAGRDETDSDDEQTRHADPPYPAGTDLDSSPTSARRRPPADAPACIDETDSDREQMRHTDPRCAAPHCSPIPENPPLPDPPLPPPPTGPVGVAPGVADDRAAKKARLAVNEPVTVSTLAGTPGQQGHRDGDGDSAKFSYPSGLAFDPAHRDGGRLIIADRFNHRIRTLDSQRVVRTLAGSGKRGFHDGDAHHARFDCPMAVAADGATGAVYVADCDNHKIRVVRRGLVTTLAGGESGYRDDPKGLNAQFARPTGVVVADTGEVVVADCGNHCIRIIYPETGHVQTLAGNGTRGTPPVPQKGGPPLCEVLEPASEARFSFPFAVACMANGDLLVADCDNNAIRRVHLAEASRDQDRKYDPATIRVSTVVSSGQPCPSGRLPQLHEPTDVAVDLEGNIFIADNLCHSVRMVTLEGELLDMAGPGAAGFGGKDLRPNQETPGMGCVDGAGEDARFRRPARLCIKPEGGCIAVADRDNAVIRAVECKRIGERPDHYQLRLARGRLGLE